MPETPRQKCNAVKRIELKKVDAILFGEKQTLEYGPLIRVIVETPQNQERGAQIDEIRKSIRILERLEAADDFLELEDADYDYLCNRVKNARFTSNNAVFAEFVEYIERVGQDVKEA